MADQDSNAPFPPGVYVKGDQTRRVETPADGVQAAFDGFTRVQEDGDVASGFASVNDNDPESPLRDSDDAANRQLNDDYSFEQKAAFSDDQADVLEDGPVTEGEHPDPEQFESESVSDTAATPAEPSGEPVDRSNPSRSFSF